MNPRDALAVYRLTRLAVWDSFPPVANAREDLLDRFGPESSVSELLTCPWCISFWIAFSCLGAKRAFPRTWNVIGNALALSCVAGLLSNVERAMGN